MLRVSMGELLDAGIGFDITEPEADEDCSIGRKFNRKGELVGLREVNSPQYPDIEPLTQDELDAWDHECEVEGCEQCRRMELTISLEEWEMTHSYQNRWFLLPRPAITECETSGAPVGLEREESEFLERQERARGGEIALEPLYLWRLKHTRLERYWRLRKQVFLSSCAKKIRGAKKEILSRYHRSIQECKQKNNWHALYLTKEQLASLLEVISIRLRSLE